MAPISYFRASGSMLDSASSFFNFPTSVQLGVQNTWIGPPVGVAVAYKSGDWLFGFADSWSTSIFSNAPPSFADANGNVWTQDQAYPVNGSAMLAFHATANNNGTPDTFNFTPGSWAASSWFSVIQIAAAAGAFTVSYGTSSAATISVTTPSGYTLTLPCIGSPRGGPSELIIYEWGGGIAGQTYRIAFLVGNPLGHPAPIQSGWTDQTNNWFAPYAPSADAIYEFSDVQCVTTLVPPSVNFVATVGGANPPNQNVAVSTNNDPQTLTFVANQTWIVPQSGSITTPGNITLGVNTAGLLPGTYTGKVTFSGPCGGPVVNLNLIVSTPCVVTDGGGNILSTFIKDLGLNIAPATQLYEAFVPPATINTSEYDTEGRTGIVMDFNSGDGLYSRDFGTAFTWSLTNRLVLYVWQPSLIEMPENQFNRPTDWDDAGTPGAKFIQGIVVEADSFNSAKTFQLQSGDDLSLHPLNEMPATFIKQTTKAFSCVQPFVAHSVRIVATDSVAWRVWKSNLVFEPWPEQTTNWQTEQTSLGLVGWNHVREANLPYVSNAPVTFVLTFDAWPTIVITLPSSNGVQVKTKVTLPPNKWKLIGFRAFSSAPFNLFERDVEFKVKSWGSTGQYNIIKPFGGMSKEGADV